MPANDLEERIKAVKSLTSLFQLERFVYIGIIGICLIVLLLSVGIALFRSEGGFGNTALISSMFGSGGVITVMTGRLIHMWNRAMALLDARPQ